jgi:hypothetical protein
MKLPTDPAQLKRFKDPVFRISNLYSIRTREGKVIPFRPRRQQLQVLDMLYRQRLKRVCILKARQLGFSTLPGIVSLDQLCWSVGRQVSLVDTTQEDARQKLKNIVALAYDSLHAELKARFLVDRANAGEFGVRFHEVQRVAHMLNKDYLYGSHYLPHDALATQKSGKTFLNELNEVGLRNCKAVPRILDIWVGINRLRQILPRFSFRIPACERLIEALSNYHTVTVSSTGLALDEPVHDWPSHFADSGRVIAEAQAAGMLRSAGSTANVYRRPVTVRTGFRGDDTSSEAENILDRFFAKPRPNVRVIR